VRERATESAYIPKGKREKKREIGSLSKFKKNALGRGPETPKKKENYPGRPSGATKGGGRGSNHLAGKKACQVERKRHRGLM